MNIKHTVLLILSLTLPLATAAKTVTDSVQRQVEIPDNPQRIVVGESRMLYTLALVESGNPAKRIVGWPADLKRLDKQTWDRYVAAFPAIAQIPLIGNNNFSQLNAEKIIALQPDLIILPVYARTPPGQDFFLQQMKTAGIPVIYLDFRVDPLHNTVPSLRTLGEVLNDQGKAEKFIVFYQHYMTQIRDRLARAGAPAPTVMLQLHLGRKADCCTTVGHGNLADLIAWAGGRNIAAGQFSGVFGQISPEALLTANPDIYLATGMAGPEEPQFLQLGAQVNKHQAASSFQAALQRDPVVKNLPAVRQGRAYAIWQNFYMSPWHLLDVVFFAHTFHPTLFSDMPPEQVLDEMNAQFLTLKEPGTYWTGGQ